jgi:hypothetical protein
MSKNVWITALGKDKDNLTKLLKIAKQYGLSPDGHFWVDDLPKMAWEAPLDRLSTKDTALWVILSSKKEMAPASVRYGLSLLALSLQSRRGIGFPILFVTTDPAFEQEDLPTPFRDAQIVTAGNPSLGAKLTARANMPIKKIEPAYRLDIHANQGYGIWFEFGPVADDSWNGVLAGGLASKVNAHGVGPCGMLPLKTVLEYQMQGLKLTLGNDTYDAWAVKNTIDQNLSYYVRFEDIPGSVMFGPLPGDENEADLHVLKLV